MSSTVIIDSNHVTRVNGKPFFPITARHIPVFRSDQIAQPWSATPQEYAALRAMGFNAVRFVPFGGQGFTAADQCVPADFGGLMFYAYVFNRAELSADVENRKRDLVALVEAVRFRDDLFGYEQFNEPAYTWMNQARAQASPQGMAAGSAVIRQLDPNHPIRVGHMCSNLVATLQQYNTAADIVSCNPYVVQPPGIRRFVGSRPDGYLTDHADRTLSAVGRYTDKMKRVAQGRQVWMQVQGSSNENWYSGDHTPEIAAHGIYPHHHLYPTYWQMRFMAFHAIIHGAMGLEWMLCRHPVDAPSFLDVRRIIGELRDLHDVLASPTVPHTLEVAYSELGFSDWEGVETLIKVHHGRPLIIAANTQMDPMEATFTRLPPAVGATFEVVGEKRQVNVKAGRFDDFFKPYEVHIYRAEERPCDR